MNRFVMLINMTLLLTLLVIGLGAYTRLTDAGLGCPDWPGCYGKLTAPVSASHIAQLQQKFPSANIQPDKAHNEMLHRFIAAFLGFMVLTIFVASLYLKCFRKICGAIFLLTIFQAALGMWTVTLQLLPLVVLAHLLGGFGLFSLLALLRAECFWKSTAVRLSSSCISEHYFSIKKTYPTESKLTALLPFGYVVLILLLLQIMLGVWTSSNYAATVCYQLPFCEPGWRKHFSLQAAINLPLLSTSYQFGVLPLDARISIHVLHRMGAILTFFSLAIFLCCAWYFALTTATRKLIVGIASVLLLQLSLGLINVLAHLPLANAVAHTLVAANLLMLMVIFVRKIYLQSMIVEAAHVH